jgi:uncharacterized OsmC-like protein
MTFTVTATRQDEHLSHATNSVVSVPLGTDMAGNDDALNPMELLLSALSACLIKGTNRLIPILDIDVTGMDIELAGTRLDEQPGVHSIHYAITVHGSLSERDADLLHKNLLSFGTVTRTIAQGTDLQGTLTRAGE